MARTDRIALIVPLVVSCTVFCIGLAPGIQTDDALPGASGKSAAIKMPSAVAHRRMVEGTFLHTYEYFSLDGRAPQMMNERSLGAGVLGKPHGKEALYGGSFVAPRWGEATSVAFTYRLTVGEVEKDRQVVQLYLTPQSAESAREFLAFEYVYTRQH